MEEKGEKSGLKEKSNMEETSGIKETSDVDELSCQHLRDYIKANGVKTYRKIHTFFVSCNTPSALRRKYNLCFCYLCDTRHHRLHACLICPFFGCYENKHIQGHYKSEQCPLAVDITTGHIYCFLCEDYIYGHEFELFSRRQKTNKGKFVAPWLPTETVTLVKKKELYFNRDYRFLDPWEPDEEGICRRNEHPSRLSYSFFMTFRRKAKVEKEPSEVTATVESTNKDSIIKGTADTAEFQFKVPEVPCQRGKTSRSQKSKGDTKSSSSDITPKYTPNKFGSQKSKGDTKSSSSDITPKYIPDKFGLRGLCNSNNTLCYLNSILQILTHVPCLRNLFLSVKHNPKTCRLGQEGRSACLVCEMYLLTQEFFSGKTSTMSAEYIFYLIWKHKHSQATTRKQKEEISKQQDAHEILILILELLHEHMKSADEKDDDCNCYIHQLFTGILEKEFSCVKCGKKTSKFEEFNILSLNLELSQEREKTTDSVESTSKDSIKKNTTETKDSNKNVNSQYERSKPVSKPSPRQGRNRKKNNTKAQDSNEYMDSQLKIVKPVSKSPRQREKSSETKETPPTLTLMNCIEQYCKPEIFMRKCDACDQNIETEYKKIEKLHTAPVIMCFHFKRKENNDVKNSTFVSFPELLDITPYFNAASFNVAGCSKDTKPFADQQANQPAGQPDSQPEPDTQKEPDSQPEPASQPFSQNSYCLTGVICHIEPGHYISFIKMHNNWYKCDDDIIIKVEKAVVLESEAYLLFYQKEKLDNFAKRTKEEIEKRERDRIVVLNRRRAIARELKEILTKDILKLEET